MKLNGCQGLVVTSIQAPNHIMRRLGAMAQERQVSFFVIGDRKSPPDYVLDGASYLSMDAQHARFGAFSRALPENHYARKNLGYLAVLSTGVDWVIETDDDNEPFDNFFDPPPAELPVRVIEGKSGWVNAYNYFEPTAPIWPRGLPLEQVRAVDPSPVVGRTERVRPRLIQGLADENPDVDAIFRLTRPLPVRFGQCEPLGLGVGQWCPFNSQNTWFHRDLAPLLYLPTYCSFRMTDIWRSFIAQRCLWAAGEQLVFVAPTVRQERNEHNLLRDFADEVPGYLANEKIRALLEGLVLTGRPSEDLVLCYEALIAAGIMDEKERQLVSAWLDALAALPLPA